MALLLQGESFVSPTMPIVPVVDVVICGGGLGGLALANGLINNGFSVVCFEKNSAFQPKGAVIGIVPNGYRALELLTSGLGSMMFNRGTSPGNTEKKNENAFPNQTLMHAWADVRKLLLNPNLDLRLSSEFNDFVDGEDFIESHFTCKEDGLENQIHTVRSRVLIGADGIHSSVRKYLNLQNAVPTGAINWRCTVEAGPDDIEGVTSHYKVGDRVFGQFNVANGMTCWSAVDQRDPSIITESVIRKTRQEIKEEALQVFSDFPKNCLDLIARTNADHIFHGPILVHDMPLANDKGWGSTGRVALLGDSAHGMRPSIGQGAAMAFEDAVILCRKLKESKDLSIRENACNSLLNYENERLVRVKRVQQKAVSRVKALYSQEIEVLVLQSRKLNHHQIS